MKLQPEPKHLQLNLSLLDQPPTQLPEGQDKELALGVRLSNSPTTPTVGLRVVVGGVSRNRLVVRHASPEANRAGVASRGTAWGFTGGDYMQTSRCSFKTLWAIQTSAHSPCTFSTPRSRNCRNPRACLICPNTGSTIAFRVA
jgi:hypothetical protein